ncbi:MAG: hypothetical protein FOGNACKC_02915 [Anaerolineae bacterium]|nr:hypothetical protein [Anaerolineae bacterium]
MTGIWKKLSSVILLMVLISSYGWLWWSFPPANVEVVVPRSEKVNGWQLSPAGDKIAYMEYTGNNPIQVLLFPKTHTKQDLGCENFIWLDDETLYCSWQNKIIVIQEEKL